MDHQIECLVSDIQKLVPSETASTLKHTVSQMSQSSGTSMTILLTSLFEDLHHGIPFRHTSVGRFRGIARL